MRWTLPKPIFYGSLVCSSVGGLYLVKDYMNGPMYEGQEKLTDKVVVVTGANTGIGRETAFALAQRGAKVVMACRNTEKCEIARRNIVVDTKNKYVYCRECDLASYESIKKFVTRFQNEHNRLDILINNAGVMRCPKSYTKEGIERQLGVNHMGPFLLTNLLLDRLKESAPSKIINLSSQAHLNGKLRIRDLNSEEEYDPSKAYAQSKLANILFTKELAKRLAGTGVTVLAVHPGVVNTEITRHMKFLNSTLGTIFLKPFMWPFVKSPKHGAQAVLRATLDPEFNNKSGIYLSNWDEGKVSEDAMNDQLAEWLWKVSEKWTRLNVPLDNASA